MDNRLKYYDDAFFKKRQAWRDDYEAIGSWIDKSIEGKNFGDIGCGNGYMISSLYRGGKKVWGVDAAENFEQYVDEEVRQYVKKADITQTHKLDKSDVVLCFEVAERIDKKYADTLIQNIVNTRPDTILFTAAKPGQAGIHHINLQPREYWLDKFKKHGYYLDAVLNEKFKNHLAKKVKNLVWYIEDIMILQKCDSKKLISTYADAGDAIEQLKLNVGDLTIKNTILKNELSSILGSKRWKVSSRIIGLIKR